MKLNGFVLLALVLAADATAFALMRPMCKREAGLQQARNLQRFVAQVSNLLCRGFPTRQPDEVRTVCRLEVGETAGW